MKGIGKVPTIAVLTAMLVSVNGRPPTGKLSVGATRLAGVVLPEEGAGYECPDRVGGERKW